MKQPCNRCAGRGFIYDVPGHDIGKLTVPQIFQLIEKIECAICEGTGNAAPIVDIKFLRKLQVTA